ncbi:cobalamin biosynthesis protein [Streptomyces sp. NPDC055952]|uniref:cobalamin biosynthesis protein n=1 Tax=Streptomyces sp. NPDC055952 TaxID=3345663 RepID=UPI0035D96160
MSGGPSPVEPPGGRARVVVGVGASKGVPVEEVLALVEAALREAGLPAAAVAELATADAKAGEPGIVAAARQLGVPLVTYPAGDLARVGVPHPSEAVRAAVGTPSVAEAAALLRGGALLVPKRRSGRATCAVARLGGADAGRSGAAPTGSVLARRTTEGHHQRGHGQTHAH